MTFKEWTAALQLVGLAIAATWLLLDATHRAAADWTIAAVATQILWVIAFMVVFMIAGLIAVSVGLAAARREEFKDVQPDERDLAVEAKSCRNAYRTVAFGGIAVLIFFATGQDPVLGIYVLFGTLMLGGLAEATSQLVYYRIG